MDELGIQEQVLISSSSNTEQDELESTASTIESFFFNGPNNDYMVYLEDASKCVSTNKHTSLEKDCCHIDCQEGQNVGLNEGLDNSEMCSNLHKLIKRKNHSKEKRRRKKKLKETFGDDFQGDNLDQVLHMAPSGNENTDLMESEINKSENGHLKRKAKSFTCYLCPFTTNFREERNLHLLKMHPDNINYDKKDSFPCNDKIIENIPHHSEIKNRAMFECSLCSFTSHKLRKLNFHMSKSHDIISTFSDPVMKSFESSSKSLVSIVPEIQEDRPYQCDKCNFSAKNKANLNSHKRIHRSSCYSCEYCEYTASRSDYIRKHELTHISSNICCVCGIYESDNLKLAIHLKYIHNISIKSKFGKGKVKYRCCLCNEGFKTNKLVKEHACLRSCGESSNLKTEINSKIKSKENFKMDIEIKSPEESLSNNGDDIIIKMGDYILNVLICSNEIYFQLFIIQPDSLPFSIMRL